MDIREQLTLSDVLQKKGYIRGPFGSSLKRGDMKEYGIPVYEQQHAIYNHRNFRYFVDDVKFNEMQRFQVRTNDLIISCSGTVGKVSIINDKDPKGIISQALLLLRVNTDKILPEYLRYFFISREGYNAIVSRSSGSVQVNISKRDVIEQIPLCLPTLATQKKIVDILGKLDKKIKINGMINKNLEEQVLALYRNKFIDIKNYRRHTCRAKEYFDISIGKTPPRKEHQWFSTNHKDITWTSISDMRNSGLYIGASTEYLTKEAIKRHNIKIVPDNTVLLSFKLTIGRIAITNGEMATNEAIAHFKTDQKSINEYLYCYLKYFNYETLGSTSSIATALNSKIIKNMPFVVPTDEELKEFYNIAKPMFAKIKANQDEIANLKVLRDLLLPKLISGEIDISNIKF